MGVNTFKNLMIYINLTLESFADHDNLTPIVIYFNKEKYNSFARDVYTSLILIRFACKICCGIDNILISWHDKQIECFALY